MPVRYILYYLVVDVFSELDGSFSPAGRTYSTAFTGEGDKERVFASVTVDPGSTVGEDSTIEILIKGLGNLIRVVRITGARARSFQLRLALALDVMTNLQGRRELRLSYTVTDSAQLPLWISLLPYLDVTAPMTKTAPNL
jgi:hypothetical protein